MKKFLLFSLIALASLPGRGQVTLGYADEMTSGWGDMNSVITPYVVFPKDMMEPYKGNEITSVKIGVMEDASNCYLYIKRNANDNDNLYRQKLDDLKAGWNEIILDTPFEINAEHGIAIGYKGSFAKAGGVGVGSENFSDGDVVYYNSKNSWTTTGGSICINAIIDGENLPNNELGIYKLSENKSLSEGDTHCYSLFAKNLGNNEIGKCEIDILLDDVLNETIELENIGKNERRNFEFYVSSTSPGTHTVEVKVKSVNGTEDAYAYNNSLSANFMVLDSQFLTKVICEEFTGTWCGWCPRGMEGLEMMKEKYPGQFLAVSIHMNDKLEIDQTSDYSYYEAIQNVSGAPYCTINRKYNGDPFNDIQNLFNLATSSVTHLAISAAATMVDDGKITVRGEIISDMDLQQCNYNIAFTITEDGITGYYQTNYYSGVDYEFFGWEKKDPVTFDVVFNDVARAIIGGFNGMSLFKGDLVAFEPYEFEFTFDLPSNIDDLSKINVIAQVIDPTSSFTVNATGVDIDYSGVKQVTCDRNINLTVNKGEIVVNNEGGDAAVVYVYDVNGRLCNSGKLSDRFSCSLKNGFYIINVVFADGEFKTWKVNIL